jgi:hypothetical protein
MKQLMLFTNLICQVVLRFSLILLHSNRFDLIDYPEYLYFRYQTLEPRSYIIQTDSGEMRRNRRHLVKIPESVKDNDKITTDYITSPFQARANVFYE